MLNTLRECLLNARKIYRPRLIYYVLASDFNQVSQHLSVKPFSGSMLSVERVPKPSKLQIEGLTSLTEDLIHDALRDTHFPLSDIKIYTGYAVATLETHYGMICYL